jgi:hypothetical protein
MDVTLTLAVGMLFVGCGLVALATWVLTGGDK